MQLRFIILSASLFLAPASLLNAQASGAAPSAGAKKTVTLPRTKDGHPDLQGVWTNATVTRMERLPEFNGKLNLTDEEASKFEKKDHDDAEERPDRDGVVLGGQVFSGANAGYNILFIDRGNELARVDGKKRSSLIIDPPDGRVPPMVPRDSATAGRVRGAGAFGNYDNVKNRPVSERCLVG